MATELTHAITLTRGIRLPPSTINRQDDCHPGLALDRRHFQLGGAHGLVPAGPEEAHAAPRPPPVLRRIDDGERLLADRLSSTADGTTATRTCSARSCRRTCRRRRSACCRCTIARRASRGAGLDTSKRTSRPKPVPWRCRSPRLSSCSAGRSRRASTLETEWRRSRFLDNLHATALALDAVDPAGHRCEAFRV